MKASWSWSTGRFSASHRQAYSGRAGGASTLMLGSQAVWLDGPSRRQGCRTCLQRNAASMHVRRAGVLCAAAALQCRVAQLQRASASVQCAFASLQWANEVVQRLSAGVHSSIAVVQRAIEEVHGLIAEVRSSIATMQRLICRRAVPRCTDSGSRQSRASPHSSGAAQG